MSIATEIRKGGPPVDQAVSGKGWEASLSIAWAQIVEGGALCDACEADAHVAVATGADPDYAPLCWTHAALMIDASRDLGQRFFGEGN